MPDQVFNADETVLYWKLMHCCTYQARMPGHKLSTPRTVSVLFCSKSTGTYRPSRCAKLQVYLSSCPKNVFEHLTRHLALEQDSLDDEDHLQRLVLEPLLPQTAVLLCIYEPCAQGSAVS